MECLFRSRVLKVEARQDSSITDRDRQKPQFLESPIRNGILDGGVARKWRLNAEHVGRQTYRRLRSRRHSKFGNNHALNIAPHGCASTATTGMSTILRRSRWWLHRWCRNVPGVASATCVVQPKVWSANVGGTSWLTERVSSMGTQFGRRAWRTW
jgi:hypothetical protein